jgi:hypothetical protein
MNRFKKAAISVGIAAFAALPLTAVTQTANAAPAQAATTYVYHYTKCSGKNLYQWNVYRVDYSWYEEVFLGKKDYTYSAWGPLIQYNAPQCSTIYV